MEGTPAPLLWTLQQLDQEEQPPLAVMGVPETVGEPAEVPEGVGVAVEVPGVVPQLSHQR